MRFLPILLLLVMVILLLFVVLRGARGTARTTAIAEPQWQVDTELMNGMTVVVVRQVAQARSGVRELGRQVIAQIPDGARDWEIRYHEAMADARARVAALRSQSG